VNAVCEASETLGYSTMDMVFGAGHVAICAARLAPAGMIFVPCKDGISHNEIADAKPGHLEAGCNVLLLAMLDCAKNTRHLVSSRYTSTLLFLSPVWRALAESPTSPFPGIACSSRVTPRRRGRKHVQ
jgi:hypothetical protein